MCCHVRNATLVVTTVYFLVKAMLFRKKKFGDQVGN